MGSRRTYRPRWIVGLIILTLPIWFVPALIFVGWQEAGRDVLKQIGPGLRWALLGRSSKQGERQ